MLSAITVVELFNAANIYSNSHYKYLGQMTLVGVFFLLVSIPSAYAAMRLERRFRPQNTGDDNRDRLPIFFQKIALHDVKTLPIADNT